MGSETPPASIPKIDFSGLIPDEHGKNEKWDAVGAQVMHALKTFGCFEVVYDTVIPDLWTALFEEAMVELFDLPLETKMTNSSVRPFGGFIGNDPKMAFESLAVLDGEPMQENLERFTRLMWADGNPTFGDIVLAFAKNLKNLLQIVVGMILQSLGVEKHYDSFKKMTECVLRLSKYWLPSDPEVVAGMEAHLDLNLLTVVCQHQVQGLEVQTTNGKWIPVVSLPNTFTVFLGEAFEAWTNGRLKPPLHRVTMGSNEVRYSTLFGLRPRSDCLVQAPKDLVDEDHPAQFKPYIYQEYLKFYVANAKDRSLPTLKEYCGVEKEDSTA